MTHVMIANMGEHIGQQVTLQGWVTGLRSSGKIAFIQLRDGSGFIQGIVVKSEVAKEVFDTAKRLTLESSVHIRGEVRTDTRSKLGIELGVQDITIIQEPLAPYPITPKEHGVDFLFEHRHLFLRHKRPWAIMRIRDEVERAFHDFFHARGFLRCDAPFFMPTAVEGTTNLFEINLFDEDNAYLSQSGQLYAEALAQAYGKIYTFGPTFRAEKSKTRKHLLEFWMIEPEMAYLDHDGNIALQEALVTYLFRRVLEHRQLELDMLERDVSALEKVAEGGFARISYDEALALLAEHGEVLTWGDDLGAPHETLLGSLFEGKPVFIEAWPTQTKAFYMQPYDDDPSRVKCADMIAPEGYGEIIGGSQRIHDHELLKTRIMEHQLPLEAFAWYLDLRQYGSVPHSGFGIGLERTLAWITGAAHLREVIPFPRMLTRMYP